MCHPELPFPISGGAGVIEESLEIAGEGVQLPALFARPDEEPAPGIVIIHDVYGFSPFSKDVARRLAGEGFAAVLPDLFVRQGPLEEQTIETARGRAANWDQTIGMNDLAHVMRWLSGHEATDGSVGVVGFCMGGTLAFLLAGREPLPAAAVAYYGFPAGRAGWTTRPLDEVDRLAAPVLALWGDQDAGVGVDNMEAYRHAADAAGKPVETVIYPGLPHGFLTFDPASANFALAQDSWNRTLAFLRKHLPQ